MVSDLFPDGQIDCKDYALRNAQIVRKLNETPVLVLTPKEKPNHIFVMFVSDGIVYVLDGDRVYSAGRAGHVPLEE